MLTSLPISPEIVVVLEAFHADDEKTSVYNADDMMKTSCLGRAPVPALMMNVCGAARRACTDVLALLLCSSCLDKH